MKDLLRFLPALLVLLSLSSGADAAASSKTVGGLTVYLGVLPAAMIEGEVEEHVEAAHGDVPRGRHAYHILAAVFDARTRERIEKATVEARVTPLGLAPVTRLLEPMTIAGTLTYGNYFTMRGDGRYQIELTIGREKADPVVVEFSYGHRTR